MKIHLIAIGGSVMHNMAIALHKKGYNVTGSDDAIYGLARQRLDKYGLLPSEIGWHPETITSSTDLVILGMHARPDNPELIKALELKIPVMSFPEFIYYQSKDKKRVVIAGSHGKTSITSMIMHVLHKLNFNFDYAVGSSIEGFEDSVRLTEDAPVIIIEGDEYLSSPIDRRPKFMWYHPQIAVINGIAWDHINVFPTYDEYVLQFSNLISDMVPRGKLIYFQGDKEIQKIVDSHAGHLTLISTEIPEHEIKNEQTIVKINNQKYGISIFGNHNLQNLSAAQKVCEHLGISEDLFWKSIKDFKGAGKRLEKVINDKGLTVFRDFAHAPSKVKGSTDAVAAQFSQKQIIAFLELHTFSSLNKSFIPQYAHSLDGADKAYVYIDTEALNAKSGDFFTEDDIKKAFKRNDIIFIQSGSDLNHVFKENLSRDNVFLLMSSGNLGGLNVKVEIEKYSK
jgi:UDP-N-acetylmuramate: L-alanyl-gamma-D-glutamyl-meso-diaminopimelate ligase